MSHFTVLLLCFGFFLMSIWMRKTALRYPDARYLFAFILLILVTGTIWLFKGVTSPDSSSVIAEDNLRSGENMIQYAHRRQAGKSIGWRADAAITISNLNIRERASAKSKIVATVPAGYRVVLGVFSKGEWFEVTAKDLHGWMNGRYLRPVLSDEVRSGFRQVPRWILSLAFPESTLRGKIFGWLVGVVIALILGAMVKIAASRGMEIGLPDGFGDRIPPDLIIGTVVVAYYFVKTGAHTELTASEATIAMVAAAILGWIAGLPASLILRSIPE
jgi:hypothetical protein